MEAALNLGDRLERFVEAQIREGRYADASEVVRVGLLLLERSVAERDEQLAAFRASIEEALASGPAQEIDFDTLRADARHRVAAAENSPSDAR